MTFKLIFIFIKMVKLEYLYKYIAYQNEHQHNTRTIDIRNILKLNGSNIRSRDFPFKTVVYYWIGFWYPVIEEIIYSYDNNYEMKIITPFNPKQGMIIYIAFKSLFEVMTSIHDKPYTKRDWYKTLKLISDNISRCIAYLHSHDIDIKIDTTQQALIKAPKKINYPIFIPDDEPKKLNMKIYSLRMTKSFKLYASLPEDSVLS